MRPSPIPWSPRLLPNVRRLAVVCLLPLSLALASGACVSPGDYRALEAERDRLAAERDRLAVRVERLEASTQSLGAERVSLLDELEDLRQGREALEAELAATERRLAERSEALEAQRAAMRELQATYDGLVTDLQADVEAGRMAVERLREGIAFELPDDVVFPPGAVEPTPEGRAVVRRLAARLKGGEERIEVHGHTDGVPVSGALARRFPSNWELAAARASAVVRLLAEQGIDPARLVAVSHGAHDPVAPNDTQEGRARNRRIEIRLIPPVETLEAGDGGTAPAEPDPS